LNKNFQVSAKGFVGLLTMTAAMNAESNLIIVVLGNRSIREATWDAMTGEDTCLLMNDDQIRMADSLGFEIGAHSMNHLDLVNVDPLALDHEILWSKYQIEQILGKPVISFAYPYGRVNKRVQQEVFESGFEFACGVYTGPAWFGEDNFDIRRIAINDETSKLNFLMKILTPFEYVEWSYARLKEMNSPREQRPVLVDEEQQVSSEEKVHPQKSNLQLH